MKKDWKLPSLKAAQIRTPQEAAIERSLFALDPQARSLGVGRRYYIHTYGCQANERDSETIAGILEAMGFTAALEETDADLILLNTSGCHMLPLGEDPCAAVLYCAKSSDVALTMVDGRILYRNGVFYALDVERIRREVTRSRGRILSR